MKILVTGSSGLIGSIFCQTFDSKHTIITADLTQPSSKVDILDPESVSSAFESAQPEAVIHLAAFTDVTKAWEQTENKSGLAYRLNVEGTQNIVTAANAVGAHVVHVSTAFVFDGEKEAPYIETDDPNPIEWYGKTKLLAEELVSSNAKSWCIARIDKPFSLSGAVRPDILQLTLKALRSGKLYPQFTNHWYGPTVIQELVKVFEWLAVEKKTGVYHATSGESWSDYEFAKAVADAYSISTGVEKGDLNDYLKTLNRPYQKNTALDCSKLFSEFGKPEVTIQEALVKAAQLEKNSA